MSTLDDDGWLGRAAHYVAAKSASPSWNYVLTNVLPPYCRPGEPGELVDYPGVVYELRTRNVRPERRHVGQTWSENGVSAVVDVNYTCSSYLYCTALLTCLTGYTGPYSNVKTVPGRSTDVWYRKSGTWYPYATYSGEETPPVAPYELYLRYPSCFPTKYPFWRDDAVAFSELKLMWLTFTAEEDLLTTVQTLAVDADFVPGTSNPADFTWNTAQNAGLATVYYADLSSVPPAEWVGARRAEPVTDRGYAVVRMNVAENSRRPKNVNFATYGTVPVLSSTVSTLPYYIEVVPLGLATRTKNGLLQVSATSEVHVWV